EADSLEMARALAQLGFTDVACSPHARPEYASGDPAVCAARRAEVQAALEREGIGLRLHENAENVLDAALLAPGGARFVGQGPWVLAEAPYVAALPQLSEFIFRCQVKGISLLVAHPERC